MVWPSHRAVPTATFSCLGEAAAKPATFTGVRETVPSGTDSAKCERYRCVEKTEPTPKTAVESPPPKPQGGTVHASIPGTRWPGPDRSKSMWRPQLQGHQLRTRFLEEEAEEETKERASTKHLWRPRGNASSRAHKVQDGLRSNSSLTCLL